MKTGTKQLHHLYLFLLSTLLFVAQTPLLAQDATKKIDININTHDDSGFLASPWIWVVGAAVFVLLLVALLRGGRRTDA